MQYFKAMLVIIATMWAVGSFAQDLAVEHAPKIVCAEPAYHFGERRTPRMSSTPSS